MNRTLRGLAALVLATVAIAGCSRHSAPTAQHAQRRPADAALAVKPQNTQSGPAERAGGMPEESESVADIAAGLSPIAAAVAANTPAAATPIPAKWVERTNYNTLVPAEPTSVDPNKVEVTEVFWYGCVHCFHLDPTLEAWRKKGKPAYVEFVRVPAMWNEVTRAHARLFYTMKRLNKLEELHSATFDEIHVKHDYLVGEDPAATEELQRAFLKAHGVTDAQFDSVYRSLDVAADLRKAEDINRRYQAISVPWLVVNGKYTADVGTAGGESQLIELINDLAASERRH